MLASSSEVSMSSIFEVLLQKSTVSGIRNEGTARDPAVSGAKSGLRNETLTLALGLVSVWPHVPKLGNKPVKCAIELVWSQGALSPVVDGRVGN